MRMKGARVYRRYLNRANGVAALFIVLLACTVALAIEPIRLTEIRPDRELAEKTPPPYQPARIEFTLQRPGMVTLAVYERGSDRLIREIFRAEKLEAGRHTTEWDGLDRNGRSVPPGAYQWRLLSSQGFAARFVTTLGINPPSGLQGYFPRSWVGDHTGAGIVCVDQSGVYIGSPLTEGLMQTLKQSHDAKTRLWQQRQYYDGGQLTRMAADAGRLFLIQANGNLRRLDANTGGQQAVWKIIWDKEPAADIDVCENNLVVCYRQHGAVRWIDPTSGRTVQTVEGIPGARAVTVREDGPSGEVLVVADAGIHSLSRQAPTPVKRIDGTGHLFEQIDVDHTTGEIYVLDHHQGQWVRRFDRQYKLVRSYGGPPRPFGRYDPKLLSGATDVAADGRGGFYIAEPATPPRRTAHFDAQTGRVIREWYGGQSFYVDTAVDPRDPTNVWGCAGEGYIHHYKIDYDTGKWTVHATYAIGRLGDSLYPFSGKWHPMHRGGKLYLRHGNIAAVVRVDEENRRVVPAAIASYAHNGPVPGTPYITIGCHRRFC